MCYQFYERNIDFAKQEPHHFLREMQRPTKCHLPVLINVALNIKTLTCSLSGENVWTLTVFNDTYKLVSK